MRSLRQAGYSGFIDVSEGMLGSARGPGWVATGLPVVNIETAIAALPLSALRQQHLSVSKHFDAYIGALQI